MRIKLLLTPEEYKTVLEADSYLGGNTASKCEQQWKDRHGLTHYSLAEYMHREFGCEYYNEYEIIVMRERLPTELWFYLLHSKFIPSYNPDYFLPKGFTYQGIVLS